MPPLSNYNHKEKIISVRHFTLECILTALLTVGVGSFAMHVAVKRCMRTGKPSSHVTSHALNQKRDEHRR